MSAGITLEQLQVIVDAQLEPYRREMAKLKEITENATNQVKKPLNNVNDHIKKNAANTKGAVGGLIGGLGKIFAGAFIAKKVFDWGKYSTQIALEVSAAMNQIKRTMGESTQSFLKWAKGNALAYNLAEADAVKYGAVFSNLFSGFIKNQGQLTGYTVKMLETSAVVASATGRTMEDVMNRIRSGMLGSTEAIEDLGIYVNIAMIKSTEAFKRMSNGMNWDQLDFQTQQAIRMMAILEQASTKFGNSLMQGPATSLVTFRALMKNVALNMGNAFLPVIQAITPVLVGFARVLNKVTGALATFMQLLFNKKAKASPAKEMANDVGQLNDGLGSAGQGADNLGKGLGGAGKQAKALKKEMLGLLGFDEINLLNKNNDTDGGAGGSGGGGGSGGAGGLGAGVNLPQVSFDDSLVDEDNSAILRFIEKLKKAIEYLNELLKIFSHGFKSAFKVEGLDRVHKAILGIGKSMEYIFNDGQVANAFDIYAKQGAYAAGQITGAFANAGLAIAVLFTESIEKSLERTRRYIKKWLVDITLEQGETLKSMGNIFEDVGDIIYDALTSVGATRIGSAIVSVFTYSFMTATEVVAKLGRDLIRGVERIIGDNKEAIKSAFTGTLDALAPAFETLEKVAEDCFKGISKLYDDHVRPFIDDTVGGLSQVVGTLVDGYNTHILPVLQQFGEKFSELYETHLKPFVDTTLELLGKLFDFLGTMWNEVLTPMFNWIAENIMPILAPIIEFIGDIVLTVVEFVVGTLTHLWEFLSGFIDFVSGVLTFNWGQAWDGIAKMLGAVWDIIKGILKLGFEFIGNIMKLIAKIVWEIIKSVFDFVINILNQLIEGVKNFFRSIRETTESVLDSIINFILRILKGIVNAFTTSWNTIKNVVSNACSGLYNAVSSWINKAYSTISSIWKSAISFISGTNLYNIGRNIIKGLINGVGSMANAVWRKAKSIARSIGDSIKGFFGINSPSKLMLEYGGYIGQGLYIGLDREQSNVLDSAKTLSNSVVNGLNSQEYSMQKQVKLDLFGDVKSAMSELIGANKQTSTPSGDIIIQIGDKEFARFAIDKINAEQQRVGRTLIAV